jgi:putative peptide zinc metalloprotease protein
VLIVTIVWVPLPFRTRAEGVVWVPDDAHVRAGADGFIDKIVVQPGTKVRRGDILITCRDPQLAAQVKVLEFRLEELQTRYAAQWMEDIRQAQIIKDEISHVEQRLARARERLAELVIHAHADGAFVLPQADNLPGRFVQQGAPLGYVLDFAALIARVVVPQADVDLVRHRSKKIEVRLAGRLSEPLAAAMIREVPAASEELPSNALGSQGGGSVAVDPTDQRGVKAMEKLFQFELGLPSSRRIMTMGNRVYVRFDHGWESLGYRWMRQLRQLFLAKFDGV